MVWTISYFYCASIINTARPGLVVILIKYIDCYEMWPPCLIDINQLRLQIVNGRGLEPIMMLQVYFEHKCLKAFKQCCLRKVSI